MYITYLEYQAFGGDLTESAFNSTIYDVQMKIDYYTFGKLKKDTIINEQVKRCIVKLISLMNTFNEYNKIVTSTSTPVISSQSNDGVSVSYGGYLGNTSPNDLEAVSKKLDTDIRDTIKQYLAGEQNQAGEVLLYRGVYR